MDAAARRVFDSMEALRRMEIARGLGLAARDRTRAVRRERMRWAVSMGRLFTGVGPDTGGRMWWFDWLIRRRGAIGGGGYRDGRKGTVRRYLHNFEVYVCAIRVAYFGGSTSLY